MWSYMYTLILCVNDFTIIIKGIWIWWRIEISHEKLVLSFGAVICIWVGFVWKPFYLH